MMSSATLLVAISVVTTGLVLGVIFSLVAAGVTIVYGSIWLPNASNGQFFLTAALICWSFTTWLDHADLGRRLAHVIGRACRSAISSKRR